MAGLSRASLHPRVGASAAGGTSFFAPFAGDENGATGEIHDLLSCFMFGVLERLESPFVRHTLGAASRNERCTLVMLRGTPFVSRASRQIGERCPVEGVRNEARVGQDAL